MSEKKVSGVCCICGNNGELTKEHVPQKKAFNNKTIFYKKMCQSYDQREIKWVDKPSQGGKHGYTLCKSCNNNTGSWYGPPYVDFVYECASKAKSENEGKTMDIIINDIYPLRVIKEVLAIMCSACGPEFSEKNAIVRDLILNKSKNEHPGYIKIYTYLLSHEGGRQTGIVATGDITNGKTSVVAELSWWPIGWILAFSDQPDVAAFDVTDWSLCQYHEKKTVSLKLPCYPNATYFPMDFRSHDEVQKGLEQNSQGDFISSF